MNKSPEITDAELNILRLTAKGMTYKEIARSLNRSHKTVDTHMMSMMRKTGLHNRTFLLLYAVKYGLITWNEIALPDLPLELSPSGEDHF